MRNFLFSAFILSLLCSSQSVHAQSFILYGDKAFGGSYPEAFGRIISDGTRLTIAGGGGSAISGEVTDTICPSTTVPGDCWLVQFDAQFNIYWNKFIGGNANDNIPMPAYIEQDHTFLFSAESNSDSSCDKSEDAWAQEEDYWIVKIDTAGNKLWDRTYGGIFEDRFPKIIRLSTGEYIVCGNSDSPVGADKTAAPYGGWDYWALKLDINGNKLWDKVYGGTGQELANSATISWNFSILADDDGKFLLAGSTNSPASGDISQPQIGGVDIWVIKLDYAGNKIWDRRYGGSLGDWCSKIIKTADEGYIISGITGSPQDNDVSDPPRGSSDIWVIKLDSLGYKQWDKRYGGTGGESSSSIAEAPGGGYWICGTTGSDTASFEVSEDSYGGQDYWMLRIDGAGNLLWDKRFGGPGLWEYAQDFVIMDDESIFLCGTASAGTSAVKTDSGDGYSDYWVVHFKVNELTGGSNVPQPGSINLTIYPNPAADNITITANKPFNGLRILNVLGEVVQQQAFTSTTVARAEVSQLPAGVYFIQVSGNHAGGVMKFVKE